MAMMFALRLARKAWGIIEASSTRTPSTPWTLANWSTTARGSEEGPILQVPAG